MNPVLYLLRQHRNAFAWLVRWGQGHVTDTLQGALVAAFFTVAVVGVGVIISFVSYRTSYYNPGIDLGQAISGLGAVVAMLLWVIVELRLQILGWAVVGANAILRKEIEIASRPLPNTPIDIGALYDEARQNKLMRAIRSSLALLGFIAAAATIFPVYTNIGLLLGCVAITFPLAWAVSAWAPLEPFWMPFIQKGVIFLTVIFLILAPIRFYSPETFGRWNREHWIQQEMQRKMAESEESEVAIRNQLISHYQNLINQEMKRWSGLTGPDLRASQNKVNEYRGLQVEAGQTHSDVSVTSTSWTEWILTRDYHRFGGTLIWVLAFLIALVGAVASWRQKKIGPAVAALALLLVVVFFNSILGAVTSATSGGTASTNSVRPNTHTSAWNPNAPNLPDKTSGWPYGPGYDGDANNPTQVWMGGTGAATYEVDVSTIPSSANEGVLRVRLSSELKAQTSTDPQDSSDVELLVNGVSQTVLNVIPDDNSGRDYEFTVNKANVIVGKNMVTFKVTKQGGKKGNGLCFYSKVGPFQFR